MQTLVELVIAEYLVAMATKNEELQQDGGQGTLLIDVAEEVANLDSFRQFAEEYLAANRPTTLGAMDGNYKVVLTNMRECSISPPLDEVRGTMQPAHAMPVTGHDTQRDMQHNMALDAAEMGDGLPVTNPFAGKSVPAGATDLAQSQEAKDLTLPQPTKKFDG